MPKPTKTIKALKITEEEVKGTVMSNLVSSDPDRRLTQNERRLVSLRGRFLSDGEVLIHIAMKRIGITWNPLHAGWKYYFRPETDEHIFFSPHRIKILKCQKKLNKR